MKAHFISQRWEATDKENSLGDVIRNSLGSRSFTSILWVSAFASRGGAIQVKHLLELAQEVPTKDKRIIVGVDQHGTSREALEELLLVGANVYVYYSPQPPIFHPKVYFFDGPMLARIIVGSSNLTVSGLFQNSEASLQIDLEKGSEEDDGFLVEFRENFVALFVDGTPNLQPLTQNLVALLVRMGLVPSEAEQLKSRKKKRFSDENNEQCDDDFSTFDSLFPNTNVRQLPNWAGKLTNLKGVDGQETSEKRRFAPEIRELIWMKKLPKSDVGLSTGSTNPTGGLRLTQAGFHVNGLIIDQTSYFRQQLFGHFQWNQTKNHPFREEARIPFWLIVRGSHWGLYDLSVKHKPSGEAGQHNYTTSISWGTIGLQIRNANLLQATLKLFRSSDPNVFIIQID